MTRGVCFSKVTEGVCHLETRETSEMSLESQPVPGWTTYPSPVIDSGFFFFFFLVDLRLVGFGVGKAVFNPVKFGYGSKIQIPVSPVPI